MKKTALFVSLVATLFSAQAFADAEGAKIDAKNFPDPECKRDTSLFNNHLDLSDVLDTTFCQVEKKELWLRVYRSQLVMAMVARYGAARFPMYVKDEQDVQAGRLLKKLEDASAKLEIWAKAIRTQAVDEPVARADFGLALIRAVAVATGPGVDKASSFATSLMLTPDLRAGGELVGNFVRDVIYVKAYRSTFMNGVSRAQKATQPIEWTVPEATAWAAVNTDLKNCCEALYKLQGGPAKDITSVCKPVSS